MEAEDFLDDNEEHGVGGSPALLYPANKMTTKPTMRNYKQQLQHESCGSAADSDENKCQDHVNKEADHQHASHQQLFDGSSPSTYLPSEGAASPPDDHYTSFGGFYNNHHSMSGFCSSPEDQHHQLYFGAYQNDPNTGGDETGAPCHFLSSFEQRKQTSVTSITNTGASTTCENNDDSTNRVSEQLSDCATLMNGGFGGCNNTAGEHDQDGGSTVNDVSRASVEVLNHSTVLNDLNVARVLSCSPLVKTTTSNNAGERDEEEEANIKRQQDILEYNKIMNINDQRDHSSCGSSVNKNHPSNSLKNTPTSIFDELEPAPKQQSSPSLLPPPPARPPCLDLKLLKEQNERHALNMSGGRRSGGNKNVTGDVINTTVSEDRLMLPRAGTTSNAGGPQDFWRQEQRQQGQYTNFGFSAENEIYEQNLQQVANEIYQNGNYSTLGRVDSACNGSGGGGGAVKQGTGPLPRAATANSNNTRSDYFGSPDSADRAAGPSLNYNRLKTLIGSQRQRTLQAQNQQRQQNSASRSSPGLRFVAAKDVLPTSQSAVLHIRSSRNNSRRSSPAQESEQISSIALPSSDGSFAIPTPGAAFQSCSAESSNLISRSFTTISSESRDDSGSLTVENPNCNHNAPAKNQTTNPTSKQPPTIPERSWGSDLQPTKLTYSPVWGSEMQPTKLFYSNSDNNSKTSSSNEEIMNPQHDYTEETPHNASQLIKKTRQAILRHQQENGKNGGLCTSLFKQELAAEGGGATVAAGASCRSSLESLESTGQAQSASTAYSGAASQQPHHHHPQCWGSTTAGAHPPTGVVTQHPPSTSPLSSPGAAAYWTNPGGDTTADQHGYTDFNYDFPGNLTYSYNACSTTQGAGSFHPSPCPSPITNVSAAASGLHQQELYYNMSPQTALSISNRSNISASKILEQHQQHTTALQQRSSTSGSNKNLALQKLSHSCQHASGGNIIAGSSSTSCSNPQGKINGAGSSNHNINSINMNSKQPNFLKGLQRYQQILNPGPGSFSQLHEVIQEQISVYQKKNKMQSHRKLDTNGILHVTSFLINKYFHKINPDISKEQCWEMLWQIVDYQERHNIPSNSRIWCMMCSAFERYRPNNLPFQQSVLEHYYPVFLRQFYTFTSPQTGYYNAHSDAALIRLMCFCGYVSDAHELLANRRFAYKIGSTNFQFRFLLFQALLDFAKVHYKTHLTNYSRSGQDAYQLEQKCQKIELDVRKWIEEDGIDNVDDISIGKTIERDPKKQIHYCGVRAENATHSRQRSSWQQQQDQQHQRAGNHGRTSSSTSNNTSCASSEKSFSNSSDEKSSDASTGPGKVRQNTSCPDVGTVAGEEGGAASSSAAASSLSPGK
ncbi:unnamed protein product [Amoebophrya sp. A120]|nr:unnamed protein product [Amoebophrya sp. A120]|eukprot:GSA120T00020410001.1